MVCREGEGKDEGFLNWSGRSELEQCSCRGWSLCKDKNGRNVKEGICPLTFVFFVMRATYTEKKDGSSICALLYLYLNSWELG